MACQDDSLLCSEGLNHEDHFLVNINTTRVEFDRWGTVFAGDRPAAAIASVPCATAGSWSLAAPAAG